MATPPGLGAWLHKHMAAISKGRWAVLALGAGAAGYVGVVTYGWRRRYREYRQSRERVRSPVTTFSSGVALGVVAMAITPFLRRWGSPRPDRVFSSVLPMLRANNEVRDMVGSALRPGLFRAYTYDGGVRWGGVRLQQSLRHIVSFRPYTLQLLFQVHGEISSAMVSLAVRNHTLWGRGLVYKSLMVDLPNGERLLLKGSSTDGILQGYSRRLAGF